MRTYWGLLTSLPSRGAMSMPPGLGPVSLAPAEALTWPCTHPGASQALSLPVATWDFEPWGEQEEELLLCGSLPVLSPAVREDRQPPAV